MKTLRHALLTLLLLLGVATLRADPENFMVGEFLFVRPTTWRWIEESKYPTLRITAPNAVEPVDVVFSLLKAGEDFATPDTTFNRWCNMFEKEERVESRTVKRIGTNDVLFAEVRGTHKKLIVNTVQPRPDSTLLGALLSRPTGNVAVRLAGPASLVDKAKAQFQKMVESALQSE
jgi:hypothetical protein